MRKPGSAWLLRALLGVVMTAAACSALLGVWRFSAAEKLDYLAYDTRLRWLKPDAGEPVIIVDIDERSLARQGRWVWPRTKLAELTRLIADDGKASVIAFDVLFGEPQHEGNEDEVFARAIAQRPVVLGYYFTSDRGGHRTGRLPQPVLEAPMLDGLRLTHTSWDGFGANIPELQAAARGAGFFNPIVDSDGVVRALPLLARFENRVYESFALAVLRQHLGQAALVLRPEAVELNGARGKVHIALSEGLTALVPFAGAAAESLSVGSNRFRYVSATDVLEGKIDPGLFKDKVVLVGTSAPGLTDLRATPVSETFPGVEIHASLIASALAGDAVAIKQRPVEAREIALFVTLVTGLVLALVMPSMGALGMVGLGALATLALVVWNGIAYANLGWVLPLSVSLMLVGMLTLTNLALGYFIEGRARRAVADLFGEYVSPQLVDRMTRDPLKYRRMVSENRDLTIMFADIRGFTRIAESMQPEDLREYINQFLTAMTEAIHRHHGTVDKYIGDAVMAFWGAPVDDPAQADQAVSAALAMIDEVERLNRQFLQRGWPRLTIGIGINSGIARVGDMGSKLRRAYTVLGDAVNLASRIEGLTKQFNTPVIVGEATVVRARTHSFVELAQVTVAGRLEPVRVFLPSACANTLPLGERSQDNAVKSPDHEAARIRV